MRINIYYGGRGLIDDPTTYVIEKMEEAFSDLRVEVRRYNIFERKNEISILPQTLKEADGIVLATSVEWFGVGGYMSQFLDACWLYGDKDYISSLYMQPVVISTAYGEREAVFHLESAWEVLGGLPCGGFSGYVENLSDFVNDEKFVEVIGKGAERLYRTINMRVGKLPSSNQAVKHSVLRTQTLELTQQESDQLSVYVSDAEFVSQQKQDILELSKIYKDMIGEPSQEINAEFVSSFKAHFVPDPEYACIYRIEIEGKQLPLHINVNGNSLECEYADKGGDILLKMSDTAMDEIVSGRMTFQRAFGMGDIKARGKVPMINKLDEIFVFS